MLNNHICALDIGSSKIAAVQAQIKGNSINKIFFESSPSKGIEGGVIVDSIDVVNCIGTLMKNLRLKSGVNVKFLHVNVSGQDIAAKHSHAIIPLAERGNKVITIFDVEKVNEQARILGSNLEEEIIHVIPSSYSIDSKNNLTNPLGLYSHRLEVDLYLICAKLSCLQSLNRVINQSGYGIKELCFSGLATGKAVFNKRHNSGISLLCDIGSDTTELLVFRNGILKDIEILPVGGNSITGRLADTLKIPFDLAEDIKRSYGAIGEPGTIGEEKEILVRKDDLYSPIKQKLVLEIITGATKLICSNIKEAAEKKVSIHQVDNFLVAGRTLLLEGFIETLENAIGTQVEVGRIASPRITSAIKENQAVSGQKYFTYLTALGMICEALNWAQGPVSPIPQSTQNPILKIVNRLKEAYQEYF